MSHTKEPWIYELPDADHEGIIIGRRGGAVVDGEFSDDNARRIVACVNACAGIPNEVLEMDQPQFVAILKQRAELAEAIRLTLDENGHLADGDVCTLKRLKDALAKVGAGTTATEGHNA